MLPSDSIQGLCDPQPPLRLRPLSLDGQFSLCPAHIGARPSTFQTQRSKREDELAIAWDKKY